MKDLLMFPVLVFKAIVFLIFYASRIADMHDQTHEVND